MKQELANKAMILLNNGMNELLHPPESQFDRRDKFREIIAGLIEGLDAVLEEA
ncbi:MAG: hypothetical protein PHR06_12565 [Candidatus Cloacimonetes bacterium]|nr:hypothetical protein [Candidatus Cloacimonadota bacterium]